MQCRGVDDNYYNKEHTYNSLSAQLRSVNSHWAARVCMSAVRKIVLYFKCREITALHL